MALLNRPINSDPLRNFRFQVTINHPSLTTMKYLGFMAVSGLAVTTDIIPYREGGNNTTTRKMPGQSEFGPITFSRGFMAAPLLPGGAASLGAGTSELYTWLNQIYTVNIGKGFGAADVNFRVGVTVDLLDFPVTTGSGAAGYDNPPVIKARFSIYNAWPMGYSFSDLEAGGNAVFLETLTLAHEGWALQTATQDANSTVDPTIQV